MTASQINNKKYKKVKKHRNEKCFNDKFHQEILPELRISHFLLIIANCSWKTSNQYFTNL